MLFIYLLWTVTCRIWLVFEILSCRLFLIICVVEAVISDFRFLSFLGFFFFFCHCSSHEFYMADTGYKSPVVLPSSTAKADRIDSRWESRRGFRVCPGGACTKGRRKCMIPFFMTLLWFARHACRIWWLKSLLVSLFSVWYPPLLLSLFTNC